MKIVLTKAKGGKFFVQTTQKVGRSGTRVTLPELVDKDHSKITSLVVKQMQMLRDMDEPAEQPLALITGNTEKGE